MSRSKHSPRPRSPFWAAALGGFCLLFYFMPLFRVVPLKDAQEIADAAEFDPVAYVENFWTDKLLAAAADAMDVRQLLAALETDRAEATQRYGQRLGLSGTASFFVSGSGRVTALEQGKIEISLQDDSSASVIIDTGPLFGNAVRDGSALLDVSKFPSSQDFNAVSSEINRRIEEELYPLLRENATVGTTVRFAGGVDIADSDTKVVPLKLVPVVIEFP